MAGDSDIDLLPWIVGGLVAAAGAVAYVMSTNSPHQARIAATAAAAVPAAATQGRLAAVIQPRAVSASSAAPAPADAVPPLPAQVQPKSPPALSNGQVWQCTVNGQLTFSDAPCGKNSSIRQLGEVNVMDSSPLPPNWTYRQPDPASAYAPAQEEPYTPEPDDDVYVANQPVLVDGRFRHGRGSRRPPHHRRSPERK